MILGYLQYSPVWLCTQLLLFLTSHSFFNLCKAISTPPISGNCFLKICNCLVLNTKDLLNSHLLDFFEASDVAARSLLGTPLLPYFSVPSTSLLYWFLSLWSSSRLLSPCLGGILSTQKRMPKSVSSSSNFPFELQTCLLENCTRVSCCYLKSCRTFLSTVTLSRCTSRHHMAGAYLYTGEPWRNP